MTFFLACSIIFQIGNSVNAGLLSPAFSVGTISGGDGNYGAEPYLEIPTNDQTEPKLRVPKAFYHYAETELSANANFGIPDESRLMNTDSKIVNNRKDINGIYLPIPNMDPINLHFVNQKIFEKGIDTHADEDSPDSALHRAKIICIRENEASCESALLHYHRLKSEARRRAARPLHEQLLDLGRLTSSAKIHDKEGNSMGVVVGVPGYDPLYIGANMARDNDHQLNVRFEPP